jgi:hypothetical protein
MGPSHHTGLPTHPRLHGHLGFGKQGAHASPLQREDVMTEHKPIDNRRARYLIAASVLVLLVLVGGTFLLIGLLRGDDSSTGPEQPTSEVVVPILTGAGR